MSMYTTGEIAKLCGVSVRTVQYYDTRSVLVPSQLSEGGRRLYSEEDLQKMKIICYLREMDLPINAISQLFKEEHPESVISLILEEQKKSLSQEISSRQQQLSKLEGLQKSLKAVKHFSMESIGDIAHVMRNQEQLRKIRTIMLTAAIPFGIMEWTSIALWIFQGVWWPFVIYALAAVPFVIWIFRYYYKNISYICPQCHGVFKPEKWEFFFASHTMTTRKLTCTCCGHKGFCVETYGGNENGKI